MVSSPYYDTLEIWSQLKITLLIWVEIDQLFGSLHIVWNSPKEFNFEIYARKTKQRYKIERSKGWL